MEPESSQAPTTEKSETSVKGGKLMKWLMDVFGGFCMALADSVPGVSGGTIAFILGFYDEFIGSLDGLIYGGSKGERRRALKFLLKLGLGWAVGMALAIAILTGLFSTHIYAVSSLFMGFIVFSIPLIVWEERKELKTGWKWFWLVPVGAAVVWLITWLYSLGNDGAVDVYTLNIGTVLYIVLAGAVAISAMILPGISGSTLLLIFGLYLPLVSGAKGLLSLDFSALPALILFAVGVVTGAVLVIRAVNAVFKKHRSAMVFLILGLMLGSLYAIAMGPTTLAEPQEPLGWETFNFWFFLLGGVVIGGLEMVKRGLAARREGSKKPQQSATAE